MKASFFYTAAVTVLLSMAVACSHSPSAPVTLEDKLAQRGFVIGEQVKKVINLQVNSWNSLDDRHVIMRFGASRNYLLTLRTSCDSLIGAVVINFSTTVGSLTDNDKLLVRDSTQRVATCFISTIHELKKIEKTG